MVKVLIHYSVNNSQLTIDVNKQSFKNSSNANVAKYLKGIYRNDDEFRAFIDKVSKIREEHEEFDVREFVKEFEKLYSSVTYGKVANNLKTKATVTSAIDLSANGIGAITLSANTAFSFSNFELNKSYLLIITANGFTPSWANGAKHIPVTGNESFGTSGVFYVNLTCINATAGSEKLLTTIMKGA